MTIVRNLTPAQVSMALGKGTCDLIDVREPDEFAAARIPGAVSMPLSSFSVADIPQETGRLTVISCAAGGRSMRAAEQCARAGLTVFNLTGGLSAWADAGLRVERER